MAHRFRHYFFGDVAVLHVASFRDLFFVAIFEFLFVDRLFFFGFQERTMRDSKRGEGLLSFFKGLFKGILYFLEDCLRDSYPFLEVFVQGIPITFKTAFLKGFLFFCLSGLF